jgi:hypothetical protein
MMTSAPTTISVTVLAPNYYGQGISNVGVGLPAVVNPLDGLSISVLSSDGGVVVLAIDPTNLRAAVDVSTDFDGVASRRVSGGVQGLQPAAKFDTSGGYVATATATTPGTAVVRGKGRHTLMISGKEVGSRAADAPDPTTTKVTTKSLKGKFGFTAAQIAKGDTVTLSAQVELPVGTDLNQNQELSLGIGNILDHVIVNPKGKPVDANGQPIKAGAFGDGGNIKKVSVKFPKTDKTKIITAAIPASKRLATVTVTLFSKGMVARGFDTEGVDPNATTKSLKIQVGFVLAGVAYENTAAATLKVATKKDTGSIGFSRSGN